MLNLCSIGYSDRQAFREWGAVEIIMKYEIRIGEGVSAD